MTVTPGDDCGHHEVGYNMSSLHTAALRTEVHNFQCAGCEVCARIVRHVPMIPQEEE